MKAILVDPMQRSVVAVEHEGTGEAIRDSLRYPGDEHFIFTVIILDEEGKETMYFDDEGLLKIGLHKFKYDDYDYELAGKALIIGTDEEGDSVSTELTAEEVFDKIRWSDRITDGNVPPMQFMRL